MYAILRDALDRLQPCAQGRLAVVIFGSRVERICVLFMDPTTYAKSIPKTIANADLKNHGAVNL